MDNTMGLMGKMATITAAFLFLVSSGAAQIDQRSLENEYNPGNYASQDSKIMLDVLGEESELATEDSGIKKPALRRCVSDEVGVSFACDPLWKLTRLGKTLKITISQTPRVEFVITESDQAIHFMSELTRDALAGLGRYEEGFHIERFRHCDRETVKVNGYLKGYPGVRVSDFYLVDHLAIHSVKFTVEPKDAWEDYKWIIKEIIDSVLFIKHKPGVKFNLQETDESCEELTQ